VSGRGAQSQQNVAKEQMMAGGIFGISVSGLNAAQAGIRTTEHNIANVNREGYRRQEVDYSSSRAQYSSSGYFGNGVQVDTVRRVYNQFLDNSVLQNQTQLSRAQTYTAQASSVDKMLGDAGSGLSTAMDSFFAAVNSVANDPTADAPRQVLIAQGNNLVGRINALNDKLNRDLAASNSDLATMTSTVSTLAARIANLNSNIGTFEAANGQPANDLRDQRDELIGELNKLVNVSTLQQSDGSLNVYIGSGQPLVVGHVANSMTTVADPLNPQLRQPALTMGSMTLTLDSRLISGGEIGGILAAREQIVIPAKQELDRLAFAFADQFNTQHQLGFDLAGNAGVAFFSTAASMLQQPAALTGTTGAATLTLAKSSQLVASDYDLTFDGTNYTLTRLSDGASTTGAIGAVTTIAGQPQGFTLSVAGAVAGDRWSVRPIADAAYQIDMNISSASLIAAASTSAGSPGDSANALILADLHINGGFTNGVTFNAAYNSLISRTASLTSEADLNVAAFTSLVSQAEAAQRSTSGVNLDEEAVNLISFQQAYQASARAIQVASSLFDEILALAR
jgi:flagellar hook-associated protein 1 FlgK